MSDESLEEIVEKAFPSYTGTFYDAKREGALWGLKQGEKERETFLAEHDENVRLHTRIEALTSRVSQLTQDLESYRREMKIHKDAAGNRIAALEAVKAEVMKLKEIVEAHKFLEREAQKTLAEERKRIAVLTEALEKCADPWHPIFPHEVALTALAASKVKDNK